MEKVHKRYYSWYCTCKGLLSGVRANNWGAFLGNGSVPRKKNHCTDGENSTFQPWQVPRKLKLTQSKSAIEMKSNAVAK